MQAEKLEPEVQADDRVQVVYDGECPVCDLYCTNTSLADPDRPMDLIDARDDSEVMREITAAGLDIDDGMVVKMDGQLYYGAEAIHELAKISERKGTMNRLGRLSFGGLTRARWLYPFARSTRNLLLRVLGRTRINNLEIEGRDRF